jgi:hypothetical protein
MTADGSAQRSGSSSTARPAASDTQHHNALVRIIAEAASLGATGGARLLCGRDATRLADVARATDRGVEHRPRCRLADLDGLFDAGRRNSGSQ